MAKNRKVEKPEMSSFDAVEILKRPYMRAVVPESDGSFRAEILEFPGCLATGESREEALATLEEVAESWLESVMALGQRIPEPMECNDFSGKMVVRMPKSLHRKAAYAAERDGVSLNQFIVNSIAQQVGATDVRDRTTARLWLDRLEPHQSVRLLSYGRRPQFVTFSGESREGLTAMWTGPVLTHRERNNA